MSNLPNTITDVEQLEELLSRPTEGVIETLRKLDGDILFLGVGGKMGPTMARMARRAADEIGADRKIIGVSRFSSGDLAQRLNGWGIETIACDLLDEAAVGKLPEVANVVYLAAMKFGATGNEPLTWAMNTHLPTLVCRKFCQSRIIAFSTGNVYPMMPIDSGGATESNPVGPVGEYAMSTLGRERMFQYFSNQLKIPTCLIRLNYACEARYGVLVDIAQQVWSGQPIDLSMGYLNTLWQGDANAMALQMFDCTETPARIMNLTGGETLRIKNLAHALGERMGKPVEFMGTESSTALLNNGNQTIDLFGEPAVTTERLLDWVTDWVRRDGASLNKPTHFEARDGKY